MMRLYLFTIRDGALVGRVAHTAIPYDATLAFAQNRARSEGAVAYMVTDSSGKPLTAVCAVTCADRDAAFSAAANIIWE